MLRMEYSAEVRCENHIDKRVGPLIINRRLTEYEYSQSTAKWAPLDPGHCYILMRGRDDFHSD
jgi:hypothetical protein